MTSGSNALRFRIIYDGVLVVASILAGIATGILLPVALIIVLVIIGGGVTYTEYRTSRIQPQSESLQSVIEDHVLPEVIQEYEEVHPNPTDCPDVRANVMLLRYRNLNPVNRNRKGIRPWKQSLMIEAAYGDYKRTREDKLEWKTDEGAVGRAMNERAQEIWAKLDYDDLQRLLAGWHLTEAQASRTDHVESLLCVPIYLASDEEKTEPVGVLNLDCEEPLGKSQFGDETVRQKVINRANVIGAILE